MKIRNLDYYLEAIKSKKKIDKIVKNIFDLPTKEIILFFLAFCKSEFMTRRQVKKYAQIKMLKISSKFPNISIEKFEEILDVSAEFSKDKQIIKKLGGKILLSPYLAGTEFGDLAKSGKIMSLICQLIINNPPANDLEKKHEHAFMFLIEIINLVHINTWINFIKLSKIDNDARLLLIKIVSNLIVACGANHVRFIDIKFWDVVGYRNEVVSSRKKRVSLPVLEEDLEFMNEVNYEMIKRDKELEQYTMPLINYVKENFLKLKQNYLEMWQEICDNPKYLVRENGLDKIDIKIPGFEEIGRGFFQLISEGCIFPEIKIRSWLKRYNDVVLIPGKISHGHLERVSEWRPEIKNSCDAGFPQLCSYIAMHSYWQIVTGRAIKKTKSPVLKGGGDGISKKDTENKHHHARDHFRLLPAGHTMSEEAREQSLEKIKREPPENKTFVKGHSVRVQYEEAAGLKPLILYTQEMLDEKR